MDIIICFNNLQYWFNYERNELKIKRTIKIKIKFKHLLKN